MSTDDANKYSKFGIFNQRLRELRLSRGLTQAQFAENVGLSKTAMSNYENLGKTPSLDTALAIATACGVTLDWLCGPLDKHEMTDITCAEAVSMLKVLLDTQVLTMEIDSEEGPAAPIDTKINFRLNTHRGVRGKGQVIEPIHTFFCHHHTLQELLEKKAIPPEILSNWYNSEYTKLTKIPLAGDPHAQEEE